MNKTNKFKSTVSTLIMIALSFLIIYLLHDISKAVVGLLCGGKIEFNRGITIINADYGNFSYILNLILGISIPVLFLFVLVLIFNNSLRNGLYHKFTLIFFMCSVLSISICLIFFSGVLHRVRPQCWELSVNLRTLNRFTCSLKIK